MTTAVRLDPVARIQSVQSTLREAAEAGERERRLAPAAIDALHEAGVFQLLVPRSLGGEECDLLTFDRVIREAAKADGSAGWCAMISGVYGAFGGLLPRDSAKEVFGGQRTVIAGALSPMGQAVKVPGGYQVSGRWTFGSNCSHANWMVGGCIVIEGEGPVLRPNGIPQMVLAFVPIESATIIDTWTSTGLRGTGSHDYAIDSVFVPAERTFWFSDPAVEPGPLYQMPIVAAFGTAISAVAVGIAEHCLDLVAELGKVKVPVLSPVTLSQKESAQERLGVAIATLGAANAYLERTVEDSWAIVSSGGRLDWEQRGRLWLAGTHAAQTALDTVQSLYTLAGSSSVFATNQVDRCLRDARTAAQHVMTQIVNYEVAGRQRFGIDVRNSTWSFDDRGDA